MPNKHLFHIIHWVGVALIACTLLPVAVNGQDGFELLQSGRIEAALNFADKQLKKTKGQTDSLEYSAALNLKGNALRQLGQLDQALNYHHQALEIRKSHCGDEDLLTSNSYQNIANCWLDQRRTDSARYYIQKAIDIRTTLPGHEEELSSALNTLSEVHRQEKAYQKAADVIRLAIEKRRAMPTNRPEKLIPLLLNLSTVCLESGQTKTAAATLNDLEAVLKNSPSSSPEFLALFQLNVGLLELSKLELEVALQHFQKALSHCEALPEIHPTRAKCFLAAGQCLQQLGDPVSALTPLKQAANIFAAFPSGFELELADVYNDISLSYRYQGKYPQAISNLDAAINIYQTRGEATHPNLYGFFQNMGHCLLLQQSYDAARYYFGKTPEERSNRQKVDALLNIALTYQQEARYQQALRYNQEAYRLYQSGQMESIPLFLRIQYQMGIAESPHSTAMPAHFDRALNMIPDSSRSSAYDYEQVFLWAAKGGFLLRHGQKKQDTSMVRSAIPYFQKAMQAIDALERIPKAEQANLYLKDDFTPVFGNAIQAASWLFKSSGNPNDLRTAYRYLEKFKAEQLRRKLREQNPPERFQVATSVIQEKQKRQQRLYAASARCRALESATFPEDSILQRAYADLQKAENELKTIQKQIKTQYPDYHNWVQTDAVVPVDSIQFSLINEEILLNYGLFSDYLVLIAIKKDTVALQLQQIDEGFINQIATFAHLVSSRPDLQPNPSERAAKLTALGHQLYQLLIEPVAPLISESCLIIPDETLSFLPFSALLTKPVNANPHLFKAHPYFGRTTTIRYGYSSTLLRLMEQLPTLHDGQMAAFAPSFEDHPAGLGSLQHNQGEARELIDQFEGNAFIGPEAKAETLQLNGKHFPYLHFATHSAMDPYLPEAGYLAFAPSDTFPNGLLQLTDIYTLNLQAELVGLSACQTGIGLIQKGEGLMSVARAFSMAGTRSLLATLWSVEDFETSQIMTRFYQKLKESDDKALALQQSQLEYLENASHESAHPYYWSAINLIGARDSKSPLIPRNNDLWIYLFFFPVAVLLSLAGRKWLFPSQTKADF